MVYTGILLEVHYKSCCPVLDPLQFSSLYLKAIQLAVAIVKAVGSECMNKCK